MCTAAMAVASVGPAGRMVTSLSSVTMDKACHRPALPPNRFVRTSRRSPQPRGYGGRARPPWSRGRRSARRQGRRALRARRARSGGALDLAGLEARGAHVHALGGATHHGTHALDVRVPAALRADVGVRDAVPEARALAADVAVGSHGFS